MLGLPLLERRVVLRPRQLVEVPEDNLLWLKLLLVQLSPTVLTRSEEKLTVLLCVYVLLFIVQFQSLTN